MSIENNMNVAGSALAAQMIRLNAIASNIANASVVAGSEEEAFRAKRAVFQSIVGEYVQKFGKEMEGGVVIEEIVDDPSAVKKLHQPWNEVADKDGYVYASNVNEIEEMVEMLAASRSYQNNVQVITTSKELLLRTLDLAKA